MEEEKILENISKSIGNRLKVPIILTYICVLIVYNWDILFYLFFEDSPASSKIKSIKNDYGDIYYERILICLTIAIVIIILFTVLNTLLNFCLKWFYRKDKETTSEIENYEKIGSLSEQLSQSINDIKNLNSKIENLKNINENLSSKNLDIDIGKISEKDYNFILTYINSQSNKEKFLHSLKELITSLKKDINIESNQIYNSATYRHEMTLLIKFLDDQKLLNVVNQHSKKKGRYVNEFDLSNSFKDFLKMEV